MNIPFYKYQGTGNDFILIDNRTGIANHLSQPTIEKWCDRKFGIGADGLMLLQNKEGFDFEMVYYNSDGNLTGMCGNGGRCITAFAQFLGILKENKAYFLAVDGPHEALLDGDSYVELKMIDVSANYNPQEAIFLDTGTLHHVEFVANVDAIDVYQEGKAIRYSPTYQKEGVNVNFVELTKPYHLKVATYERGVEDETLSCGTGVTAAAIAYQMQEQPNQSPNPVHIKTKGGNLKVRFQQKNNSFYDIWLCGPATQVFSGTIAE